jgi:diguanylate cyclase (GGDEF)-like protein/PAS domain S-box-containing protein
MSRLRIHLLVGIVLSALVLSGGHVWLRERLIDLRYSVLTRPASATIALVEIDPPSIAAIGQWPWPRSVHAKLLQALERAGASDVVFDVDFSSPSNGQEDAAFAMALKEVGGSTILPAFRQRHSPGADGKSIYINRPIAAFAQHSWSGLVNVLPDRDGVIRRYPFGARIDGEFIPSVGSLLASRHDDTAPSFRIDFGIRTETVPSVSVIDVLNSNAKALAALRGKRVIVSGTAAELGDRFLTPNGRIMPGSMIQVVAAESILQGRAIGLTSRYTSLASLFIIALGVTWAWRRLSVGKLAATMIAIAAATETAAFIVQMHWPIAIDTTLIVAAGLTYALAAALDEIDIRGLLRMVAERRFHRIAMSLRDGLVCTDAAGRITLWNNGAQSIFGYRPDEIIGKPFESLLAGQEKRSGGGPFGLSDLPRSDLQDGGGILTELVGLRSNGEMFDLECSLSGWETPEGFQHGAVLRDISQRKRQQERIRYLAECDPISGLPNRNSLLAILDREHRDSRVGNSAIVLLSIDRYREITQLHGASAADAIAIAVARHLQSLFPDSPMIARLAGDEFAILASSPNEADAVAAAAMETFRQESIMFGDRARRVSLSIGIASKAEATDAENWLGNGQFALSAAKVATAIEPKTYQPDMRAAIERREVLEAELRLALQRNEFELFYQPQTDLRSGAVIGAEALIRWHHPQRGFVSPGEFMPVVNTSSLSEGVAAWVLETACRQASAWQQRGNPIRIGINLTQSQFTVGDLVADVKTHLDSLALRPDLVELEVTEDIILESASAAQAMLGSLRALGVKIAFDDFGTGYGSLTYLKAFPLDTIKIDQSFVRKLVPGSDDAAIVRATIGLGHALGLSVIAEGIETEEVAAMLAAEGCDEGQGYLISRPIPAAEFEERFLRPSTELAA